MSVIWGLGVSKLLKGFAIFYCGLRGLFEKVNERVKISPLSALAALVLTLEKMSGQYSLDKHSQQMGSSLFAGYHSKRFE